MVQTFNRSIIDLIRLMFAPILSGMMMAQIIATVFVKLSNSSIHSTANAIGAAGFFSIPAGQVIATLEKSTSAIWGGLFFTLSIGTGLTLIAWAAMRLWGTLFRRSPMVLAGYGIVWLGLVVYVNLNGWAAFPTLFCILVPLVAGGVTFWGIQSSENPKSPMWYVPALVLVALTALWATQLNTHLFTNIRDHILLSNPIGRSVNDFYYRNTLYAAEAFKSLVQKTVRTCQLQGLDDDSQRRQLKIRLARHDVLVLDSVEQPDMFIRVKPPNVKLTSANGESVETSLGLLMRDPGSWLTKLSTASDRLARFRKITLMGLLFGFPVLLFVIVYGILKGALGMFAKERHAVLSASAICMVIGILLFLPMLGFRPMEMTQDKIGKALTSDLWTHRVAALRYIELNQLEISSYPSYQNMFSGAMVAERYWLARAFAKSRSALTYNQLLRLIDDPHPNVVCQAFYALGERGQQKAILPIMKRLVKLDHWYAQWYGYRAMRRLGWYQRPLKQVP